MTVDAAAINRIVQAAHGRIDVLEEKLAAVIEPVLLRAGRDAARRFENVVASSALTAAGPGVTATSTMIALKPTPEQAAALAVESGLPADTLHITVCYIGDVTGPLDPLVRALEPVARHHAPLSGVVGGIGRFDDYGDGTPVILLPDVPGLSELRVEVTEALAAAGVSYARNHGFLPHLTLLYQPDTDVPSTAALGLPLSFGDLLIVRGDVEVVPLHLSGPPPITAAALLAAAQPPPSWHTPYPDEIIDVAALVAEIKARIDPVRLAVIETMVGGVLDEFSIDFDITNPFVATVMQQSASQVTDIADTTRLNVMRTIRASYDAGLSIPHTAQAIRAGMAEAAPERARLIARTEMVGAVNGGSLAAVNIVAQHTGVAYKKRWMTAPGAKKPRHYIYEGLNGQTRPLSGQFDVGGYPLSFPGDPAGPAHEVCNCRCALGYDEPGL